jgi:hypothetical protein
MSIKWYINYFSIKLKKKKQNKGIYTQILGTISTYRNWNWDSTKKHKNFCPHRSDVINTFEACEFFSLK